MGGLFGVASRKDCMLELFYGVDYHSHLGTRRGGMAAHGEDGFCRAIHNIENAPFRTKFERDVEEMKGNLGIGCISSYSPIWAALPSPRWARSTTWTRSWRRLTTRGIPISRR